MRNDANTRRGRAINGLAEENRQLRAKVAELAAEVTRWQNYWPGQMVGLSAENDRIEAQLAALPKWAQSSESKGQFYRKYIQEMAALREQLAALREGIRKIGQLADCERWHERFPQTWNLILALLTQTTPPVNSADAVNGGEDSGVSNE